MFLGNANANFTPVHQSFPTSFGLPSSLLVASGDFDGNGTDDFVRVGPTGAWLFRGLRDGSGFGDGSFKPATGAPDIDQPSPWQLVVGDFTGDGRADFARLGETKAYVFAGRPDGTFATLTQSLAPNTFSPPSSFAVAAGKFTGPSCKASYVRLGSTEGVLYHH
jgi:hypothetical protein